MKYLFLNHKMNLTLEEIITYRNEISNIKDENVNITIFPSFINIPYLINNQEYNIGSQNVCFMDKGSYTGEVSAKQLKSLGVKYTLVGHSERRNIFNETYEEINKKIKNLQSEKITPVLCIGEKKRRKSTRGFNF